MLDIERNCKRVSYAYDMYHTDTYLSHNNKRTQDKKNRVIIA